MSGQEGINPQKNGLEAWARVSLSQLLVAGVSASDITAIEAALHACAGFAEANEAIGRQSASLTDQRDALWDDRRRALKIANALTQETQTCEEAVADLVRQVREARKRADDAEAETAPPPRSISTWSGGRTLAKTLKERR